MCVLPAWGQVRLNEVVARAGSYEAGIEAAREKTAQAALGTRESLAVQGSLGRALTAAGDLKKAFLEAVTPRGAYIKALKRELLGR